MALQIPNGRAERLKVEEGSVLYHEVPDGEMLSIEDDTGLVLGEVERAFLNEVMNLRTKEILSTVRRARGGASRPPWSGHFPDGWRQPHERR
jgi:cell division protein FtsA